MGQAHNLIRCEQNCNSRLITLWGIIEWDLFLPIVVVQVENSWKCDQCFVNGRFIIKQCCYIPSHGSIRPEIKRPRPYIRHLYRKSNLCIYIHKSLSGLYIPRIGLPIWMQLNRQTDPRNTYINCPQVHECENLETERYNSVLEITRPRGSVADSDQNPDPLDPNIFGPPGSGSGCSSQRYGSGSLNHQANCSWLFSLFIFENDVNIRSKSS